jgi:hypothetical protein
MVVRVSVPHLCQQNELKSESKRLNNKPMNNFYIGLATTIAIIGFLELFKTLDKRLLGAFTLGGIGFIYVGFAWSDLPSLITTVVGVAFFLALSYLGYKRNFHFIIIGLIVHGLWDILYPLFFETAPEGYDIFCITIDVLLAIYFFLRVRRSTAEMIHK